MPNIIHSPAANLIRFNDVCEKAAARSLLPEYRGCTLHVSAIVAMWDDAPTIIGYRMGDWYDDSVVRSYTNGRSSN